MRSPENGCCRLRRLPGNRVTFFVFLIEVLEEDNPNDVQISKFVKRVPNDKRKIIFEALLNYNVEGKVRHGEIRDVARNVDRKMIQINPDEVSRIPLNRRTTIRSMATTLNMSKTSLHRRVKEGSLKSHSCYKFITNRGKSKVNKEVTRKWLVDYVLPAIRVKWPLSSSKSIFIQQDNAKPHISVNDAEFLEAAQKNGFDIRLTWQPPNSPDMNVLDLVFFRAIQYLQYQESPRNVDELVVATQKAFDDISIESLSNIFLTLQLCMVEVMKRFGGNNYKIPHINKQKLEQEGQLPTTISCDMEVLNEEISSLQH
nr:Transposase, Tc1-like protein [Ipomoea batatas]